MKTQIFFSLSLVAAYSTISSFRRLLCGLIWCAQLFTNNASYLDYSSPGRVGSLGLFSLFVADEPGCRGCLFEMPLSARRLLLAIGVRLDEPERHGRRETCFYDPAGIAMS